MLYSVVRHRATRPMPLRTPWGESTFGRNDRNSGKTKLEFLLNTCTCLLLHLNPPAFFDKLINRVWVQLTFITGIFMKLNFSSSFKIVFAMVMLIAFSLST